MFSNQMCNHYIPVTGRLRTTPSTLSSFNGGAKMVPFKLSSSTMHLNFGGVQIGHSRLAIVSVYILLEGFRLVTAG